MATCFFGRGDVRGDCGHKHYSLRGLAACQQRDSAACKSQGGYTDRQPMVANKNGSEISRLDASAYLANEYYRLLFGKKGGQL